MIHPERIRVLANAPVQRGDFVLYWMQQSQRADDNHALEYAIDRANELDQPVVAVFGLTDAYPEANERHYAFMLEGLKETEAALARRGVRLVLRLGSPAREACEMARAASLVVVDRGYLRHQRVWRQYLVDRVACPVAEVESDVVVPVGTASNKEEIGARTLRPRIARLLPEFLAPLEPRHVKRDSLGLRLEGEEAWEVDALLLRLTLDRSVRRTRHALGGADAARRRLDRFLHERLSRYAEERNNPAEDLQSGLSPYLHFGQISPLRVALEVSDHAQGYEGQAEAFLEELVVRRELAVNFVEYNREYDRYECLPEWARETLLVHSYDPRAPRYDRDTLEAAETADPYWNAAMKEMTATGAMHGYMRMYWGKKIIEWSPSPQEAFLTAIHLNNKYFLDGRDATSYGNVAWLFGKHDRPWKERPIFGKVRYMNARGLERKFDMEAYIRRVDALADEVP